MESDREWGDIKIKAYNQPLQPRFTQTASGAEALHQVVPLAAGRTLGMTPRPRSGGGDSGDGKDGSGSGQRIWPIKDSDFWLLRHLGFLFMMRWPLLFSLVVINCMVVEISN